MNGKLKAYDILDDKISFVAEIVIKKSINSYVPFNDKRTFDTDIITDVNVNNSDGTESHRRTEKKAVFNDNIVGYLRATSFNLNANSRCLTRTATYDALKHSYGFYLRSDNYKDKLPLWTAKLFPQDNWYDKDVYFTTSDGGDVYTHDNDFLKSCLIYTCLSNQNKCFSFDGSDGRYYRNELCFDTTNGDTVASADLAKMTLDTDEKALMKLWDDILSEVKKTANYDSRLTYGVYQITKELNTSHKIGSGRSQQTVYDYPTLNGYLETLRTNLKAYYKSHITDKMFHYELLK